MNLVLAARVSPLRLQKGLQYMNHAAVGIVPVMYPQ